MRQCEKNFDFNLTCIVELQETKHGKEWPAGIPLLSVGYLIQATFVFLIYRIHAALSVD